VRTLLREGKKVAVSRIAYAEIAAALARKERDGDVTRAQADAIFARLGADFSAFAVVEIKAPVVALVPALVRRHPLRGYDAVQLACALAIRGAKAAVTFWCSDVALEDAARAEGLRTTRTA
jgi:predicted nucleic acid-binding protein